MGFLSDFRIEAYADRGYDTNGHSLPSNRLSDIELKNSPEWEEYEDERLEVANLQAQGRRTGQAEPAPRRGYRVEVRAWMKNKDVDTTPQAAKTLGVGESTLKSIMSDRGEIKYGQSTLDKFLKNIGVLPR